MDTEATIKGETTPVHITLIKHNTGRIQFYNHTIEKTKDIPVNSAEPVSSKEALGLPLVGVPSDERISQDAEQDNPRETAAGKFFMKALDKLARALHLKGDQEKKEFGKLDKEEVEAAKANLRVGASAAIKRGMLLGASAPTAVFDLVSSAADASKVLVIARDNFTAGATGGVTQAYASGKFNRERIIIGGDSALTLEPFEDALRKSNIRVTSILDKF